VDLKVVAEMLEGSNESQGGASVTMKKDYMGERAIFISVELMNMLVLVNLDISILEMTVNLEIGIM
jgi:hypothetical protein